MKKDYERIEKRECQIDGGKPVSNSGRGTSHNKGDYILEPFLVDIKYTEKSFTLSTAVWAKVSSDANKNGYRMPALKVVMENTGQPLRLWVLSDTMYKEMLEAWKHYNEGEA